MTNTTAAYYDVRYFDARTPQGDFRPTARLARAIGRNAVIGAAALATVGLLIVTVTLAAAWLAQVSLSGNSQARAPGGPAMLALVPATAAHGSFEPQWARSTGTVQIVVVPEEVVRHMAAVPLPPLPPLPPQPPKVAAAPETPLPAPRPPNGAQHQAAPEIARAPAAADLARIATVTPPAGQGAAPQEAHNKAMPPPEPASRTAVYDIAAHTVYLPDGQKLEAHSGLGDKRDNPRYVHVRMRGSTPPNIYDLALRERLFHGVRAIRLNPVDDDKMFGRDGMLAHSYMLGSNGQSNGCVSFREYSKFLQAFLKGKVDRLVVVAKLGNTPWRAVAALGYVPDGPARHYAANSPATARSKATW